MRMLMAGMLSLTIVYTAHGNINRDLSAAVGSDLRASVGGACSVCLGSTYDVACNTGFKPACEQQTGFCVKYTFTGINVDYCRAAAVGEKGSEDCNAHTPQVCVRIRTCTGCAAADPCTNCGPESTEDKPTKCKLDPYKPCTG